MPLATIPSNDQQIGDTVLLFESLQALLSVSDILLEVTKTPPGQASNICIARVAYTFKGEEFQTFVHRKDNLFVNDHVLLWGSRFIVHLEARERVMIIDVLHSTYPGVSHM